MPVTIDENEQYRRFVNGVAQDLGVFDFAPDQIIWHYTNDRGLLGIIQSATLFATQVAFLNDDRETRYATELFATALQETIQEQSGDEDAVRFLRQVQELTKDHPVSPTQGTSKFFITSFSADEDEVTQWDRYSKDHGYAIGFFARGFYREPNSQLYRVIYERQKQVDAVKKLVAATLTFYRAGLTAERQADPEQWGRDFFLAWDEWIYKLAPLAKDEHWRSENEFRLAHELKPSEFSRVRFVQKDNVLARYLPLDTSSWMKSRQPLLPIAKIVVGPGNEKTLTPASVRLLLEQMGYPTGLPVETTNRNIVWRK